MAAPEALDEATIAEVTQMVEAASEQSLAWFRRPLDVDNKQAHAGGYDPVTAADRGVEDHLRAALTERFPDDRILGEERGETGQGVRRWVIDPIDGTRAFVSGNVLWGTLLGLQHEDRVLGGWMRSPAIGETWVGTPDTSWLDTASGRRQLSTSATTDVADAILCASHPEMFTGAGEMAAFDRVSSRARLTRFGGDCINYGLLALGTVDLVIEAGLEPYDIMALIPIIEGAGGIVTDRAGARAVDGGFIVAAANPELHAKALDLVNSDP